MRTRDLSRGGNHGGGIGIGDGIETKYAIGEPNECSYSWWQLAHIKNKSDICSNFEEVLGIHQGYSNHHHHNRHSISNGFGAFAHAIG